MNGGSTHSSDPSTPTNLATRDPEVSNSSAQYLGSTSYSAVFTEGQRHPSLQGLPDREEEIPCTSSCVTEVRVREGVEILALLLGLDKYEDGLRMWFAVQCTGTTFPGMRECMQAARYQREKKKTLYASSEQIWANTSKPLVFKPHMTMQDMPHLLLGENLRWDMVGLMLTTAGLAAICTDEVTIDPEDDKRAQPDWKSSAFRMLEAGGKCISFCEAVDELNIVGAWLIMLNYILHTQVHGDAGK